MCEIWLVGGGQSLLVLPGNGNGAIGACLSFKFKPAFLPLASCLLLLLLILLLLLLLLLFVHLLLLLLSVKRETILWIKPFLKHQLPLQLTLSGRKIDDVRCCLKVSCKSRLSILRSSSKLARASGGGLF